MLIAVAGSSGLAQVAGVSSTHPAALLHAVEAQPADHVIVLVPWYASSSAREQAHVLIAAKPDARVCVLPFEHHPFTLTLLAAVTLEYENVADGWSEPDGAVQLLKQMAAAARSIVWHPRAWGLEESGATLAQRAASLFKTQGYFSELGASGLVHGRGGLRVQSDEILYAAGEPPALLRTQLGGTAVSAVAVEVESNTQYSTKASVELTELVRPTRRPVEGVACVSCSARRSSAGCFFCGGGPRVGLTSTQQCATADRSERLTSLGGTAA